MAEGKILRGDEVTQDLELTPDVCIIGSGAGGAIQAYLAAKAGKSVVVLEEGGYHTSREFDMQEGKAFPMLYQELGNRATADLAITILQGRAVGGTTVVNWTTSFRTPKNVLSHWEKVHGVEGLDEATLNPHWDEVEKRLSIHEWPLELVNANNRVLWDGCEKLGLQKELLHRNVKNCLNTGYCGMGCPVDAKQSMLVTYLPDAVKLGATVYANTRADTLELSGRRIAAVHATVSSPDGKGASRRLTVRPKLAILSGGAINSPALLLRSKLNANGRVGQRTFLHPVVAMAALFEERVEAFYGAPQSVGSHHYADRGPDKMGFFMETPPIHPMLGSTAFAGFGGNQQEFMSKLAHTNVLIALSIDGFLPGDDGGTVSLRPDGRVKVDYPMTPPLWESMREASKVMARIQLASGAQLVSSLHNKPVIIKKEADIAALDGAEWGPNRLAVFSAHCMGGCAMGKDPKTSVVDAKLRHHELDNLFIVDGSALPTSLGVNPQETIFGISHWASGHILQSLA